jgi:hypothetical protein
MKIFILVLLATLNIINNTDVAVDMLAVPNECSSLGGNNPLIAKDCQVYEFTKKYCCMLTITYKSDDSDDVVKTSCIKLDSISNSAKSERVKFYKNNSTNIDVLIECYGNFINRNILINILLFLLLF